MSRAELARDLFVVACITLLLALRAVPVEAGLPLLAAFMGMRAFGRIGGPGAPPPGAASLLGCLVLVLTCVSGIVGCLR